MSTVSTITVAVLIAVTLIIVFVITCTVCLRSRALRQEELDAIAQAIVEEALANISLYSASDQPPIYEVQVAPVAGQRRSEASGSKEKERMDSSLAVDWDHIMPVSCRWVNPPEEEEETVPESPPSRPTTPPPLETPAPDLPSPPISQPRPRWVLWPFGKRSQPPLLPTVAPDGNHTPPRPSSSSQTERPSHSMEKKRASGSSMWKPPITPEPEKELVRAAVFIRMPFSDVPRQEPRVDDEQEVPRMEFGVIEVCSNGLAELLARPPTPPPMPTTLPSATHSRITFTIPSPSASRITFSIPALPSPSTFSLRRKRSAISERASPGHSPTTFSVPPLPSPPPLSLRRARSAAPIGAPPMTSRGIPSSSELPSNLSVRKARSAAAIRPPRSAFDFGFDIPEVPPPPPYSLRKVRSAASVGTS